MASHASASTATPGAHTTDNTPTGDSHIAQLIKKWGVPVIIGAAALIGLFWIGSAVKEHRAEETREQARAAAQAQVAQTQQAHEAARLQRVCGSLGEPSCKCQGADTVMRYLPPRRVALLEAKRMKFEPPPGMGYKLCHPDKLDADGNYTDCVDGPEQNLHVGLTVAAVNTSDTDTVALKCEYMP